MAGDGRDVRIVGAVGFVCTGESVAGVQFVVLFPAKLRYHGKGGRDSLVTRMQKNYSRGACCIRQVRPNSLLSEFAQALLARRERKLASTASNVEFASSAIKAKVQARAKAALSPPPVPMVSCGNCVKTAVAVARASTNDAAMNAKSVEAAEYATMENAVTVARIVGGVGFVNTGGVVVSAKSVCVSMGTPAALARIVHQRTSVHTVGVKISAKSVVAPGSVNTVSDATGARPVRDLESVNTAGVVTGVRNVGSAVFASMENAPTAALAVRARGRRGERRSREGPRVTPEICREGGKVSSLKKQGTRMGSGLRNPKKVERSSKRLGKTVKSRGRPKHTDSYMQLSSI
uniref:Uncharacterized protein n=1 Tax=Chromera velia CCMP2878 TaxID=1169474 RepID=A0A0G4F329_9ALVE|eukprot:Cvel_14910.t1-p1 / transcript=Cvel_14910.t1 / gene=Cvel_14910 / organism=Chromera_velia_CCMP2878 / gene_product=hypothetical protein / transcript_product=hypothetical protein / location=Cvel_scaffold1080:36389-37426(+) / protein_length=346 / sequence_SO=supercontig / SO=protein_coding / is_pseudo=false